VLMGAVASISIANYRRIRRQSSDRQLCCLVPDLLRADQDLLKVTRMLSQFDSSGWIERNVVNPRVWVV